MELLSYDINTVELQCSNKIIEILQDMSHNYPDKKLLVALSGGNSPKGLLKTLSTNSSIYSFVKRLVLLQVDDRVVASTHKDSNQNMIRNSCEALLLQGAVFLPIPVEELEAEQKYENTIQLLLNDTKQYIPALALLGMGADGHTASIFPQTEEHVSPSALHYVFKSEKSHVGYVRISLTFRAIYTFKHALFYVPGNDKSEMLKKVLEPNAISLYPAARVIHKHEHCSICTTVSL